MYIQYTHFAHPKCEIVGVKWDEMADQLDAADPAPAWRLPFGAVDDDGAGCCRIGRRLGSGVCIQGAGGRASHYDELYYAYDFLLTVGTPVLAAREGEVAMAVSCFTEGGWDARLKARANYVAVPPRRERARARPPSCLQKATC